MLKFSLLPFSLFPFSLLLFSLLLFPCNHFHSYHFHDTIFFDTTFTVTIFHITIFTVTISLLPFPFYHFHCYHYHCGFCRRPSFFEPCEMVIEYHKQKLYQITATRSHHVQQKQQLNLYLIYKQSKYLIGIYNINIISICETTRN